MEAKPKVPLHQSTMTSNRPGPFLLDGRYGSLTHTLLHQSLITSGYPTPPEQSPSLLLLPAPAPPPTSLNNNLAALARPPIDFHPFPPLTNPHSCNLQLLRLSYLANKTRPTADIHCTPTRPHPRALSSRHIQPTRFQEVTWPLVCFSAVPLQQARSHNGLLLWSSRSFLLRYASLLEQTSLGRYLQR
ncbi:T-complex protein 11 [Colletotrichum acutatum]